MKKDQFSFRRGIVFAGMLLLIAGVFSACKKDNGNNTPIPASGLMVFNLAPDREALGISLSGNNLTSSPLAYTSYNGNYQNIYIGSRDIESYDFRSDSIVAQSNFNFENNMYYSMFVVGNNGVYRNITVKDEVDSAASSSLAYIRYINAIPDSSAPVVTITANGNKVVEAPAKFSEVAPFTAVSGGDVEIAVSNGGAISANRTVSLDSGKIYTALLIGVPGETDTAKSVQIRYILNGTVSPDSGQ